MADPEDDEEDDEDEAHEHDLSLVHHELVDWTAPSPTAVPLKEDEEVHDLTEKRDRSWEGDNQMAKANMMEKLTDLVVSDTCSSLKAVGVSVSLGAGTTALLCAAAPAIIAPAVVGTFTSASLFLPALAVSSWSGTLAGVSMAGAGLAGAASWLDQDAGVPA